MDEAVGGNLATAIRACEEGHFTLAAKRLRAFLRDDPDNAEALYYAGLAASKRHRLLDAIEHLQRACALDPANADYRRAAWECCEAALALEPDCLRAHLLMAYIAQPGPPYEEVLPRIHEHLRPRTYLEIGVFQGTSIAFAGPQTQAIGIDPAPQIMQRLPARTTIHAVTSDEYFATHDARAEFGGLPIDLAFIDGMHLFEFALRDFINLEKRCAPGSTILIHDCYPLDRATAERERRTQFWSGDIWRLVLALKKYRPDLAVSTIMCPPTGLGVVRRLDPASTVLEREYETVVSDLLAVDYSALGPDKAEKLSARPNDWERIKAILR